jgi:uncharacterized membrane protein YoaK (UPF0700 family)
MLVGLRIGMRELRETGKPTSGQGVTFNMEIIAGIALVLLSLVGYSSGSVIGAEGHTPVPRIFDLFVVIFLWIAALATRSMLGKWSAIVIWLVIGLVLGMVLARIRIDSYAKAQPLNTGPGLWNAWKGFARRMGNYQSRVLMAFIYFVVVLPFGVGVTLLADPLNVKHARDSSNWHPKEVSLKPSIEEAREQS